MRYFEDISKTSDRRLPQRAYYIPDGAKIALAGKWRFAFFEDGDSVRPDGIIKDWDRTEVPSTWQSEGYEPHNYTNVFYPYPVDPPYVPDKNSMGIYEREFEASGEGRYYLVSEGISSFAEIYVNGVYEGFTQGSHLQAEFDISDAVKEGKNTVRVAVRKWCAGSYLEDQDFLRENGIFRDIYVLSRPEGHIADFEIKADISGKVTVNAPAGTKISIYDGARRLTYTTVGEGNSAELIVEAPTLWNAEKPYLYTLV